MEEWITYYAFMIEQRQLQRQAIHQIEYNIRQDKVRASNKMIRRLAPYSRPLESPISSAPIAAQEENKMLDGEDDPQSYPQDDDSVFDHGDDQDLKEKLMEVTPLHSGSQNNNDLESIQSGSSGKWKIPQIPIRKLKNSRSLNTFLDIFDKNRSANISQDELQTAWKSIPGCSSVLEGKGVSFYYDPNYLDGHKSGSAKPIRIFVLHRVHGSKSIEMYRSMIKLTRRALESCGVTKETLEDLL